MARHGPHALGAEVAVVVSYWAARSERCLHRLLDDMRRVPAGAPFTVTVVCNGGDMKPLVLPKRHGGVRVVDRPNQGYNIGAWDAGWRSAPAAPYVLFLQDECRIRQRGWLAAFVDRIHGTPGLGLVGESLHWNRPWEQQRSWEGAADCLNWDGEPSFNSVDYLRDFIAALGVPPGDSAAHLQSLVLFAPRRVLEQMGGFPSRDTYREAVGCEIAISRKIVSMGFGIAQLDDQRPFAFIEHPQWVDSGWRSRLGNLRPFGPVKARIRSWLGSGPWSRGVGS